MAQGCLLRDLTAAFELLGQQDPILTRDFCHTCHLLEPFFDHLGTIFHFAKSELIHKRETVVAVQDDCATLPEVFAAEKKNGTHLKKHSPARNLHRLAITLEFMLHVFDKVCHDESMVFRSAVQQAYDVTLANIHVWAVRTAVKAGLYSLPSRESFFQQIGETQASGVQGGGELVRAARGVVQRLHVIFEGCSMPCSDVKFLPSFSERKGPATATAATTAAAAAASS